MSSLALAVVTAVGLAQAAASPAPAVPAAPKRLISVSDHVKVRASPTADGSLRGYLFKNMVVEVLERGAGPESMGDKQDYWYRVRRGELTGWSFGGFFSANVPARVIDTYDLPDVNRWWGERFGWATQYYENGTLPREQLEKLEMDDYRGLLLMASRDSGEYAAAAWEALQASLYPFLKKHADDPKWRYLRDRAWDPELLGELVERHGGEGVLEALPPGLIADPAFKAKLCARAGRYLPACARPPAPK